MRKFLLFIGIAVYGIGAQAQELKQTVSFGPRAGVNMSNIYNEQEVISESVFGATVGGVANLKFTKRHALQAEIAYSGKGFKLNSQNVKNTFHYIDMPVMYQHNFFTSKKGGHLAEMKRSGNLYIVMGPQLSILMKSTAKYINTESGMPNVDLAPNTRPFDMSAVMGIGYSLKNGFAIDARYALGLRHLHSASTTAHIPQDVSTTNVQVGISYLLPVTF